MLLFMVCLLPLVCGYSKAPFSPGEELDRVCSTLIPGHGATRQPPSPRYQLSVQRGPTHNQVTVTLRGRPYFEGFIIQANWVNGTVIPGEGYQDAGCYKPTIRHVDNAKRKEVKALLQMNDCGNVALTGTVLKSFNEYYELPMVFL